MSDDKAGEGEPVERDEPAEQDEPADAAEPDETGLASLNDVVAAEPGPWWLRRTTLVIGGCATVLGIALVAFAPMLLKSVAGGPGDDSAAATTPSASAGASPEVTPTAGGDPDDENSRDGWGGGGLTPGEEPDGEKPEPDGKRTPAGEGGTNDDAESDDGATNTNNTGTGSDEPPSDADDGSPDSRPAVTSVPISGGQERIWDPCGLIRPALGSLGDARLNPDPQGELGSCEVTTGSGTTVNVNLWRDFGEDPEGSRSSVGSASLYEGSADGDTCENQVVPAGGAYRFDFEAEGSDACSAADTVARKAAAVVGGGKIPSRSLPSSLHGEDACSVVSSSALRAGLDTDDPSDPDRGFAGWDCRWSGDPGLRIIFQRDAASSDGERRTYSGRTAYVRRDAWGEGCLVDVVARSYTGSDGGARMRELARVYLEGGDCPDAETIARSVAASL